MNRPVLLDADGLAALCEQHPPERLRGLLSEARARQREVVVPAVVCAEVCRGVARTRAVEARVARSSRNRGEGSAVRVLETDFPLARQVGSVLHAAGAATEDLVDAHLVAACVGTGGGMVITTDPGDIERLAQAVPAVRIVVRAPR